jgi:AraC family transcriptional regulator
MPSAGCVEVRCDGAPDIIVMTLDPHFCREQIRRTSAVAPAIAAPRTARDAFLSATAMLLREDFRLGDAPGGAYLESLAGVVAIRLGRHYAEAPCSPEPLRGLRPHAWRRMERFIDEHLAERLDVAHLAAVLGMSPFHFARMFRLTSGFPPHLYVTLRRVHAAKRLLLDTGLPVAEVGAAVGFRSHGHFVQVFRQLTGATPRSLRSARRPIPVRRTVR